VPIIGHATRSQADYDTRGARSSIPMLRIGGLETAMPREPQSPPRQPLASISEARARNGICRHDGMVWGFLHRCSWPLLVKPTIDRPSSRGGSIFSRRFYAAALGTPRPLSDSRYRSERAPARPVEQRRQPRWPRWPSPPERRSAAAAALALAHDISRERSSAHVSIASNATLPERAESQVKCGSQEMDFCGLD
jgi:hypothetical protein